MPDNLLYYGDPAAPGLFAERDGTRAAAPFVVRACARSASCDGLKPALRTEPDTWRLCGTPRVFDGRGLSERHALRGLRACHTAEAVHEVVEEGGRVAGAMIAFRTFLGENPAAPGLAYLANMAPRLVELRRVLKPTGFSFTSSAKRTNPCSRIS